ncbi:hypothetical protein [Bradyrhizobium phage BDU-MI-1]|nr:hypothetical protein [Bradyrhizobium phage BDU-MI-1]
MSNGTTTKTFSAIVLGDAVSAARSIESGFYKVAIALAGVNAAKQIEIVAGGAAIDEKRIKNTWNVFLIHHALQGNMVWRGTENDIDRMKALKGEGRKQAARDYVMKKAKGSRLIPGLERAKTVVTELVKDMLANHGAIIHRLCQMEKDAVDGETIAETFREFVKGTYPASFSGLVDYFAKPAKAKAQKTPLEKAIEAAESIENLEELAVFVAKMQGRLSELQADAAAAEALMREQEGEEQAAIDAAAPLLIAAPVAAAA